MASAVDSRLAYARLSAVATASRLPTANRGSNNSYTTSWDTTATAHIPTQSNVKVQRLVDLALYRQRNLVERFFNKLKHFRGIATRYHKLARNFLAAVALASIRLWLRPYESTT